LIRSTVQQYTSVVKPTKSSQNLLIMLSVISIPYRSLAIPEFLLHWPVSGTYPTARVKVTARHTCWFFSS